MTAPQHDTPEAVEAMAAGWDYNDAPQTAAMLRRLHQRAVDAEREREALQAATAQHHLELAAMVQAQVATARTDALREAAAWIDRPRVACIRGACTCWPACEADVSNHTDGAAMLAAINHPTTTTGET